MESLKNANKIGEYITNFYPTKIRWFRQINTESEKIKS